MTTHLPPSERFAFVYRGCSMVCTAEFVGRAAYRPVVIYRFGLPELGATTVPVIDTSCTTISAAILRGQQTAMLWINERTRHLNWWF
ncbi:hypothetical protein [Variovorax sp. PAMC 28711]|uniref:hypothetical protein n=1 Tax=Variovorax sp. PAMC 28711 TaxID=1795631 RepID=UPI00078D16E0|nr:hypothetical protein [Variovorax sp. PAMC 28711]AMM23550.1 hypothetical protein AX767_03690 [Variovorax sp. PAMC 28711]